MRISTVYSSTWVPEDVGEDGGLASVDFRLLGHRHRGAGDGLRVLEVPKDAALGVGVQVPRVWLEEKAPRSSPGPAVHPFHHPGHRGGGDGPGLSFISTAVSTSLMPWPRVPKRPVLRVGKGQGADARHGVPDPGPQFVLAVVAGLGRRGRLSPG